MLGAPRNLCACLALLCLKLVSCFPPRSACDYELPEGFRGCVLIQFKRPDCPATQVIQDRLVFHIPASGFLCTSSWPQAGWARDEYYFVGQKRTRIESLGVGQERLIWLGSTGRCSSGDHPAAVYQLFFVGTEQESNRPPAAPSPAECTGRA